MKKALNSDTESKKTLLTEAALEKLHQEYAALIERRQQCSEEIKIARGFGDLSENAEYHAAREALSQNEAEILRLKQILDNYEIVDGDSRTGRVSMGSKVTIEMQDSGMSREITMVSKIESDPLGGKISIESPIGEALMGKEVNEVVSYAAPMGEVKVKILAIH